MNWITLFILLISIALPGNLPGDPPDLNMSLDQLMNLRVTVASKKQETIARAPGTVTVYTQNDIDHLGYSSLGDLADITPGYSSFYIYGERVFETRGQKAGSFNNNKHILLLDGIPINHARNYKAFTEEELPLHFFNRVTFLRGPGSALYGVSAFYGVVSLETAEITKNGTRIGSDLSLGRNENSRRFHGDLLFRNDDVTVKGGVGYFEKGSSEAYLGTENSDLNRYYDGRKGIAIVGSTTLNRGFLKGFTLGVIYLEKRGELGELWMHDAFTHELNDLTWTTSIFYGKYDRQLTSKSSINGYLLFNRSVEEGYWTPYTAEQYQQNNQNRPLLAAYNIPVHAVQGELSYRWNNPDIVEITTGINIDARYQVGDDYGAYLYTIGGGDEPYLPDLEGMKGSDTFVTFSGYLQLQRHFNLLAGLDITAGVRGDYGKLNDETYFELSPRVAVVQGITDLLSLKVLYGTALRAPGIKEVTLNQESLRYNPKLGEYLSELEAETIKSFETGLIFHRKWLMAGLTYFMNQTEDTLDSVSILSKNVFINQKGTIETIGLEGEVVLSPDPGTKLFLNYSWAVGEDQQGDRIIEVPTHKLNIGGYYLFKPLDLSAAVIYRWIEGYRRNSGADLDGYSMVDLNFRWSPTSFGVIGFQVRNLFDTAYKLPKTTGGITGRDVPLPRRDFILTFSGNFSH